MRVRSLVIAIALIAAAPHVHAQDGTLERVQNLIATGRLTDARQTLERWERENGDPASTAPADDRARALYLGGVLSTDAQAAEDAFIGVVLSYPSSAVAPEALLRLGQSLYTAGETDRALTYLERLRSDYPGSPQRETGMLWLTRAQLENGNAAAACGTARESLFGTTNQNVRTLIEIERDRACAQSGGVAVSTESAPTRTTRRPIDVESFPTAPRTDRTAGQQPDASAPGAPARGDAPAGDDTTVRIETPARRTNPLPDLGIAVDENVREPAQRSERQPNPRAFDEHAARARSAAAAADSAAASPPAPAQPATDARPLNGAEFAVQTAAFAERRAAETIASELRAKGFDARIVQVPGSSFFRVRCGEFMTGSQAAAAALRIRDAGFATLVVNDVRLERRL